MELARGLLLLSPWHLCWETRTWISRHCSLANGTPQRRGELKRPARRSLPQAPEPTSPQEGEIPMPLPALVERRLDAIRGATPRRTPNVRVLADFSQNTDCPLATLGFVTGVDFGRLLAKTRFQSAFSHSPFAVLR